MTASRYEIVVVGASVAAEALATRLRELGYDRELLVIDRDARMPYERPPLSKLYLTEPDSTEIGVEWDEGTPVTIAEALAVDPEAKTLTLSDAATGSTRVVAYDTLVIATGASPILLPFAPSGMMQLRTVQDADRLRRAVHAGARVGIIGAGAIGAELATSLRKLGAEVVLLDKADRPLERLLAGHLGNEVTSWLEELGVDCRWEADIRGIEGGPGDWSVTLGDEAEALNFELLLCAVGARPAVDWLASSGLLSEGQLLCNESGQVVAPDTVHENIYGIGDVVTRLLSDDVRVRTESWSAAAEHGVHLAERLMGEGPATPEIPYFWTDVAGRKVQVLGVISRDGDAAVEFENPARGSVLLKVVGEDATEGWIGVNAQPKIAMLRMSS